MRRVCTCVRVCQDVCYAQTVLYTLYGRVVPGTCPVAAAAAVINSPRRLSSTGPGGDKLRGRAAATATDRASSLYVRRKAVAPRTRYDNAYTSVIDHYNGSRI